MQFEQRLQELGHVLPELEKVPPGVVLPFAPVHVLGNRAIISGHGPLDADGSFAKPLGQLGTDVTVDEGYVLARKTGLAMLASLKRTLGDLDRIQNWVRVFGMVNSAPGFDRQPAVINGFSDLIFEVFGPEVGMHARSAVGMAALPFHGGIAVEIEAEVLLRDS